MPSHPTGDVTKRDHEAETLLLPDRPCWGASDKRMIRSAKFFQLSLTTAGRGQWREEKAPQAHTRT